MFNVAIVAGGDSGEYGISMKSGRQVELNMDLGRFTPYFIEIKGKSWNYLIGRKKFPIDKNDFSLTIGRRKVRFDIVFNAIHGTPGENGKLQGYLDMLGIPYSSCDATTSALTFNKQFCKDVVASSGIATARSMHLFKGSADPVPEILKQLTLPLFVKPNNGGSSVGMSKVNLKQELKPALKMAFNEDNEILVEEFIKGRELTCGVLRTGGEITALPVTEIIPKKEYFDYEAKYKKGMADEVVPANLPAKTTTTCQEISRLLYEKLNCKGVVRFDYIYTGKKFFFLEVNTVPGLSAASIVPKMAKAQGWSFTELVTRILMEEISRLTSHISHPTSHIPHLTSHIPHPMKEILFATNNLHKLREVREILGNEYKVLSLMDVALDVEIPETQETLEGNAAQKAWFIYEKTGMDCFADDTGLEIEVLDGRPGVYSARYAGEGCSFEDNVRKILQEMNGLENRKAWFRCVICLISEGKEYRFEGQVDGVITEENEGEGGFGYDPVFKPEGHNQTFAAMPPYLKNGISHRGRAISKMLRFLNGN